MRVGQKTDRRVLPQLSALESRPVDKPRGGHETGPGGRKTSGSQHGRGERRLGDRHGSPHGSPVSAGSDPGTIHPRVFVLDRYQQPLMPCHPARARGLLAKGRARVHRLYPFTIRLVDRTVADSEVDGVVVKLDPGSKTTGLVVTRVDTDGSARGLVSIEIGHRGRRISRNLTVRATLRRGRRSRNLRYRASRFDNRTKPEGWLAPSLRHRVDTTQTWVTRIRKLAPVSGIAMELARFDMQQMENPEISGVEYQHGTLAGFEAKEYLLAKWDRKCAYCDTSDVPLNIDHIHPRAHGGSDRISNLTLACIPCNQSKGARDVAEFVTDPARLARIHRQAKAPLRDAAAVNSTRWALHRVLVATGLPVATGSGGLTKFNRTRNGLPKSHTLDALCVGTTAAVAAYPTRVLVATSTGRGSYSRTRPDRFGFPRLRLTRVKRHFGFATGDMVRAVVPTGKNTGTHAGRVAVRATGSFNIAGVQGIHHRHCVLLARADGWTYSRKQEEISMTESTRHRIATAEAGGFAGDSR